jgi:hypothetical protein
MDISDLNNQQQSARMKNPKQRKQDRIEEQFEQQWSYACSGQQQCV